MNYPPYSYQHQSSLDACELQYELLVLRTRCPPISSMSTIFTQPAQKVGIVLKDSLEYGSIGRLNNIPHLSPNPSWAASFSNSPSERLALLAAIADHGAVASED